MSWSHNEVRLLINEYKKHPCLYAIKSKEFKNRHLRVKALRSVLNNMKTDKGYLDIKSKFNALKSNFMVEHRKVEASIKHSAGGDDLYVPTLWYYHSMLFVLEQNLSEKSFDSYVPEELNVFVKEENINDDDEDASYDFMDEDYDSSEMQNQQNDIFKPSPSNAESTIPPLISEQNDETNTFKNPSSLTSLERAISAIKKKSENEVFGEFVTSKLNKITDEKTRLEVESEIVESLYRGIRKNLIREKN